MDPKAELKILTRQRLKYEAETKEPSKAIDDLIESVIFMKEAVDTLQSQNTILTDSLIECQDAVRSASGIQDKSKLKIIQFAIGPETQKYQGLLLGLANNGKIYIDSPVYDESQNLVEGERRWMEIRIDFPK